MINSKLNGESKNIIQDNVSKLKEIFPEIVTEDKIDFDKLKLILGDNIDENPEKYSFNCGISTLFTTIVLKVSAICFSSSHIKINWGIELNPESPGTKLL